MGKIIKLKATPGYVYVNVNTLKSVCTDTYINIESKHSWVKVKQSDLFKFINKQSKTTPVIDPVESTTGGTLDSKTE